MRRPVLLLFLIGLAGCFSAGRVAAQEKPNIIFIFADDLGYADVGCYGAKGFATPHLDRMAKEGLRFSSFYTGCSVCSGSRAAFLTGRHYQRVGVPAVMFPGNKNGLNPNEITIARLLKTLGYHTFIIGKWHLGHLTRYLPTRHGFDSYYGIPYSNDMAIDPVNARFAKNAVYREGKAEATTRTEKPVPGKAPLMRGEEVIEYPVDQTTLTQRYTAEAVKVIRENKDRPFFLYLPHTMPHVPLHVSTDFKGRTKTLFGDVMEELDWSVNEILKTVKECDLDKKTLVIFTSDNGAHQGSAGQLRGKKATMYEGGFRVPCIVRWPGKVPAGAVSDEVTATVDMLPTLVRLAGGEPPNDRPIDGKDLRPLLFGEPGARTPHEHYLFPHGLGALRSGSWKFYPWPEGADVKKKDGKPLPEGAPKVQLYDLAKDIGETKNLAAEQPQVAERLAAVYERMTADLKKNKLPAEKEDAKEKAALKVPENYDYSVAMKKVAAKFKGSAGVYLHLGDSLTYANPNTAWARAGQGQSAEEKAFLKWSQVGTRDDKDGWHLASVDVPGGRSHTAAGGLLANQMLDGGHNGLPALAELVKRYNPQLALYMLGTNDIGAGRPVKKYSADVEKAVDLLLNNGTIVILSTIPPIRGKGKQVDEYNAALRELARKKQIPLLDLYAEMKARAGDDMEKTYLSPDGVHLSHEPPNGPATEENLKKSGYLLRCYLAVHKGMEVKAKVLDAK